MLWCYVAGVATRKYLLDELIEVQQHNGSVQECLDQPLPVRILGVIQVGDEVGLAR